MAFENNQMSRKILNEVWNKRNMAIIDELIDPGFIFHDPTSRTPILGVAGYKQFVHMQLTAFPDLRLTVEDSIAEGQMVATRWSATGTHAGDLSGLAPTGKSVSITGISFSRIVNGKFIDSWGNWDGLGMMQQLGLAMAPAEVPVA